MGYVIAAVVAVVIIGGFIVFLVTNETKKSNVSDAGIPAPIRTCSMLGSDDRTPAEHRSARASRSACASSAMKTLLEVARPVGRGRRG